MWDYLDTLVGAAVFGAGLYCNRFLPKKKAYEPGAPICGCEHHFSMHDPETKQCHAPNVKNAYHHDERGEWVPIACSCRQYSGPEPLPEYYA